MSNKINKINIGGVEYTLPSGSTAHVEGNALVINNNGSGGSDSSGGSISGGSTEEYKTLTITLNSTDNVKTIFQDTVVHYSMSGEQYNKLINLKCSEIKSIYFEGSCEYKDEDGHEFWGDKYYFTPTWTTYEENIVGKTPEDEIYPRLTTISGTHCDAGTLDIYLLGILLDKFVDDANKRFSIISGTRRDETLDSNIINFIDEYLNNDDEAVTSVLTLNIVYK